MATPETPSHYRTTFLEEEKLGGGGQGCVFRAKHILTDENYAIKKIPYFKNSEEEVVREAKALAKLNNPCIVRYFHTWTEDCDENEEAEDFFSATGLSGLMNSLQVRDSDSSVDSSVEQDKGTPCILYIKMELCTTSLEEWISDRDSRVPDGGLLEYDGRIRHILRQILLGLEHIHSQGIIHRDLKPANIFVLQCEPLMIKIGDFGLCKLTQIPCLSNNDSFVFGTPPYSSPEMVGQKDYNEKTDIYSLGVIHTKLLCKIMTTQELFKVVKIVLSGGLPTELQHDKWSPHVELLRKMLQRDPEERSSSAELLHVLSVAQPSSVEREALLERVIAIKNAKIRKYKLKEQKAKEQQDKKWKLYMKKKMNERISRDATKEFKKAVKKQRKEKKKPRSRHSSGQAQTAQRSSNNS